MIRNIMKDHTFLSQKATIATKQDLFIVKDLLDTLKHHQTHCVGMAANMIGENKNIIAFIQDYQYHYMLNPEIIKHSDAYYVCEEACLSHTKTKQTKRYKKIKVRYQDADFKTKIKTYEGFIAQIIQHEIDHTNGILI
ncbi:MAG: peptide deformylase [Erysipelotrichia bacterium]|nr:peptide deformylase [Erysipelotrichia bacterium]NCC53860.1 peptide deformylase [Erysipelotrichia bacterium]